MIQQKSQFRSPWSIVNWCGALIVHLLNLYLEEFYIQRLRLHLLVHWNTWHPYAVLNIQNETRRKMYEWGNTHDTCVQELSVVCSWLLSVSVLLISVLVMQAYCKKNKLMHDEKAREWKSPLHFALLQSLGELQALFMHNRCPTWSRIRSNE